jgi:hypothetical protein
MTCSVSYALYFIQFCGSIRARVILTKHDILYTISCTLHTIYYILYYILSIFYMLYSICYVLNTQLYILRNIYNISSSWHRYFKLNAYDHTKNSSNNNDADADADENDDDDQDIDINIKHRLHPYVFPTLSDCSNATSTKQ